MLAVSVLSLINTLYSHSLDYGKTLPHDEHFENHQRHVERAPCAYSRGSRSGHETAHTSTITNTSAYKTPPAPLFPFPFPHREHVRHEITSIPERATAATCCTASAAGGERKRHWHCQSQRRTHLDESVSIDVFRPCLHGAVHDHKRKKRTKSGNEKKQPG